jgi:predicted component of type VI protein secretion system
MISVELKVVAGKHAGQTIPLDRKKFLIGREQDCQLRPNTELVSRHHCVFTVDDFSVRLRDLGSTNGTSVNGETIRKEVVLQQGDHVTVGSLEFQIVINEVRSAARTDRVVAATDETIVPGSETLTEMTPLRQTDDVSADTSLSAIQQIPADVPTIPVEETQEVVALPDRTASVGDTTVISQPILMPGEIPYQQMGYPPMYGQQPYGQMPMAYPGQPYPGQPYPGQPYPGQPYPGQPYPGQPYPGQPYPGQQFAQQMPVQPEGVAVAPVPGVDAAAASQADVSLPDPATTGAKAPAPPPPVKQPADGEPQQPSAEKSNQTADSIIKQYMQKRPGGK